MASNKNTTGESVVNIVRARYGGADERSAEVGDIGSRMINFAHPDGSGRNEASKDGLVQYEERQDE